MAEGTRFKDLQEAQKRFDQILQSESMKREAAELKLQEQITQVTSEVQNQFSSFAGKFDHLSTTLAAMQLQLMNVDKGRNTSESDSVLGPHFFGQGSHSGSKNHQPPGGSGMSILSPIPKLEFPRFDGTNPRSWILKCQGYFNLISNVPDNQRVTLASMHFEGRAAQWVQNLCQKQVDMKWSQFLELVSARFEDLRETRIIAEFNKLECLEIMLNMSKNLRSSRLVCL